MAVYGLEAQCRSPPRPFDPLSTFTMRQYVQHTHSAWSIAGVVHVNIDYSLKVYN